MTKIYSIMEPTYLPSLNFLRNLMNSDIFIINDQVKYTNDLGIINIGDKEYKIPVLFKKGDKYSNVKICKFIDWQINHYNAIVENYKKAPYYNKYIKIFKDLYCHRTWDSLAEFNTAFLYGITFLLKITTYIEDIDPHKNKIEIGNSLECDTYLKNYKEEINKEEFNECGITVKDITTKKGERSILDFMFYEDMKNVQ